MNGLVGETTRDCTLELVSRPPDEPKDVEFKWWGCSLICEGTFLTRRTCFSCYVALSLPPWNANMALGGFEWDLAKLSD